MNKPVKRPAKKKAGSKAPQRGITPASAPLRSVETGVPRDLPVVIPAAGTDTPSRTLKREQAPPAAVRGEGEHSAVRIYFREIGQFARITPEEEIRLAKRIQSGDAAARQEMILANLRFVVKIALDYEGLGLPLLDLINEGNIGLMKAVERFDPAKGAKLSTYSSWWIKQSIKRGLANQGKTIRLPVHMTSAMWALNQARNRFLHENYREPTTEELAETAGVPLEEARAMLAVARSPASLDRPISDTDDTDLGDFVEDNGSARPAEVATKKMLSKEVNQVLETLTYREREILKLRYGIGDGYPYTLEQVGLIFGVTRERVRQIEAKAFDKLQDPRRRARLAGFLSQSQLTGLAP